MQARAAVLQDIAATLTVAVVGFRQEQRTQRIELQALHGETTRRDKRLSEMQERDCHIRFPALVTVAAGLVTVMAQGFPWF